MRATERSAEVDDLGTAGTLSRRIPTRLWPPLLSKIKRCQRASWKTRFAEAPSDLQAALRRAKIGDLRFHDLRHTWASWHRREGTTCDELKDLGGGRRDRWWIAVASLRPRISRWQQRGSKGSVTITWWICHVSCHAGQTKRASGLQRIHPPVPVVGRFNDHTDQLLSVRSQQRENRRRIVRQSPSHQHPVCFVAYHHHAVVRMQINSAIFHLRPPFGLQQVRKLTLTPPPQGGGRPAR